MFTLQLSWTTLPIILWFQTLYTLTLGLLLAGVFLGIPFLRRYRLSRWIGYLGMAIGMTGPVGGFIALLQIGSVAVRISAREAVQSRRLTRSTTFNGIVFPTGSIIHTDDEGGASGTLAQPTTIANIPCGPGEINLSATITHCVLAHDFTFNGFALAGGTFIQVRATDDPNGPRVLEEATLAAPTQLFEILYPAGTLIAINATNASFSAHLPLEEDRNYICLPPGATLQLYGATITGPYQVEHSSRSIQLVPTCNFQSSPQPLPGSAQGHGVLGRAPFLRATYDFKTAQWTNLEKSAIAGQP